MNENYLWDKSGTDEEIERLERALQEFRFQKTAPPDLPALIVPFEAKTSPRFFRWSFAFASFAALLIVGFGVWFQFSNSRNETAKNAAEKIAPPTFVNSAAEISVEKPANSAVAKVETSKQLNEPRFIKARKITEPTVQQNNLRVNRVKFTKPQILTARTIEAPNLAVKLTKEEVYAYDQLMLALSITGSKLKLVSDKIERVEKQTSVSETER